MKKLIALSTVFLIFFSCSESQERRSTSSYEAKSNATRDYSINKENSYNDLFFDSTEVENFIENEDISEKRADNIRNFYNSRNFQFAWFDKDGLTEQAREFWNLHQNYVDLQKDSSLHDKWLHQQMQQLTDDDEGINLNDPVILKTELELTDHFFRYAKSAFTGNINPRDLGWYIPRKKINAVGLLDSLIQTKGRNLYDWAPVNPQYSAMKQQLLHYYDIEKSGGWPAVDAGDKNVYHKDDSAAVITQVKQRLQITDDMQGNDRSPIFTQQLKDAVEHFQKRMGLSVDGVLGPNTFRELNVPVEDRIEKIMINMERMRWLPQQPSGNYVLVNIPEFVLRVFENNQQIKKMKVVVGKQGHNTQIFSDKIEYVVFSPYWNVPRSIVRDEIVPAMDKNPGYLASHNMEIVKHQNGLPVIRQKPGADNALGRVKFIFPNSFNIYLHDTPAKYLFDKDRRAFSHGCIRIEDPEWMAEWLLRDQKGWTSSQIFDAMHRSSDKWVKLDHEVPVLITYFTVWVDQQGDVNFRKDIYGHDQRVASKLFE
jgi:murein L,D-transpeptidase YcbB/YkuD